jgi:hypothetical protein
MIIGSFFKKPTEVKTFSIDWADRLDTGDGVATSTVAVDTGITLDQDTESGDVVTVKLSGGTLGNDYLVTNTVVTDNGLTLIAQLMVRVSFLVVPETSYATVATADEYFGRRQNDTWMAENEGDREAALIRATQAIDALYRGRFPGSRTDGRTQPLEWPRSQAYDIDDEEIADDEIPQEVIDATCEAALRELVEAGSMMPDLDRGGGIKRVKAGSVEVEYNGAASATTTFSLIDGILAPIVGNPSKYYGRAVRG